MNADGLQPGGQIGLGLLQSPRTEHVMSAEPGTKRPMIAQLELPQQIFIANEDEREGGLAGQVETGNTLPPESTLFICKVL
jgi:hypothetical protein